jgi:hypothetical protein
VSRVDDCLFAYFNANDSVEILRQTDADRARAAANVQE